MEKKKLEAIKIIANLLVDNGLGDWYMDFKDVTSYNAKTFMRQKKMVFNVRVLKVVNKEQLTGLAYHEIAHALLGPGHGHGRAFKAKYYELSGNLEHAGSTYSFMTHDYIYTCPECNSKGDYKYVRSRYCRNCWVTSAKMVKLEMSVNKLELVEF